MYSISTRALDANHEPLYGNGQGNFLFDIDAVAQIIETRLLLFEAEWWLDLTDGLPLFQSILGVGGAGRNSTGVALLIQQRILGTPFVTGISEINTAYTPGVRSFTFNCQVQTQFGSIAVSFQPGLSASISS